MILTALGCIIYLCISAVVRNSRCIRWIQKDLFGMLFITDIEVHRWHTNRHMGGIYKQLFCHGNTHWFTWETPGSNVSIVSLKTHTETKCWLVTESHSDRCFEQCCLISSYPLSVLSLRPWWSHCSTVTLGEIKSGGVRIQKSSLTCH